MLWGELLSDALLAGVCAALAWPRQRSAPALALGLAFIGAAAALGVLKFGGVAVVAGPHRFASGLAAGVGFPLLAYAMAWPQDPLATRRAGAARLALALVVLAVGLPHLGFKAWPLLAPAIAALMLLWTVLRPLQAVRLAGVGLLLAGFVVSAALPAGLSAGGVSRVTLLHLLLAAGLALLTGPLRPSLPSRPAESRP